MDICQQSDVSFNTLSMFVIAFLPRSKRLLISWLQSPSAMILEPKKVCHCFHFFSIYLPWSDGTGWHDFRFFNADFFSQLFHSLLSPSPRGLKVVELKVTEVKSLMQRRRRVHLLGLLGSAAVMLRQCFQRDFPFMSLLPYKDAQVFHLSLWWGTYRFYSFAD